jgi:hypothetical protein
MTLAHHYEKCRAALGGPWRGAAGAAHRVVLVMAAWGFMWASPAQSQGLPPLPKAVTPAQAGKTKPLAPSAISASPLPLPEPPLLPSAPKDIAKSDQPCSAMDPKAQEWLQNAFALLQAQMLRPNGAAKAKEAYADLWLNFKMWRDKGYDADPYGSRLEAIYKALYPAGAFAPDSPFERFKEPRLACKKKRAMATEPKAQ